MGRSIGFPFSLFFSDARPLFVLCISNPVPTRHTRLSAFCLCRRGSRAFGLSKIMKVLVFDLENLFLCLSAEERKSAR